MESMLGKSTETAKGGDGRLAYFDNLKGVLIILVVIGHLLEPIAQPPHMFAMRAIDAIYLFHMPLFIFASGLFSKGVYRGGRFRAETALFYFVLCLLFYTGLQIERMLLGTFTSYNPITLSGGSIPWYLMALGVYVVCVPFFSRVKPSFALLVSILVAVASGMYKNTDFLTASRIISFLPFFLAGYYMKPTSISSLLDRQASAKRLLFIRIGALCVLLLLFLSLYLLGSDALVFLKKLFTGRNSYEAAIAASGLPLSEWTCMPIRLLYYFMVAFVSTCIMALVPRRRAGALTRAGARSLQIYVLHPFVYYFLNRVAFASFLYTVMPKSAATLSLFALGIVLALALGIPDAPQKLFARLKEIMGKVVSRTK